MSHTRDAEDAEDGDTPALSRQGTAVVPPGYPSSAEAASPGSTGSRAWSQWQAKAAAAWKQQPASDDVGRPGCSSTSDDVRCSAEQSRAQGLIGLAGARGQLAPDDPCRAEGARQSPCAVTPPKSPVDDAADGAGHTHAAAAASYLAMGRGGGLNQQETVASSAKHWPVQADPSAPTDPCTSDDEYQVAVDDGQPPSTPRHSALVALLPERDVEEHSIARRLFSSEVSPSRTPAPQPEHCEVHEPEPEPEHSLTDDFPPDVVRVIGSYLRSLGDIEAFSQVSRQWHAAARTLPAVEARIEAHVISKRTACNARRLCVARAFYAWAFYAVSELSPFKKRRCSALLHRSPRLWPTDDYTCFLDGLHAAINDFERYIEPRDSQCPLETHLFEHDRTAFAFDSHTAGLMRTGQTIGERFQTVAVNQTGVDQQSPEEMRMLHWRNLRRLKYSCISGDCEPGKCLCALRCSARLNAVIETSRIPEALYGLDMGQPADRRMASLFRFDRSVVLAEAFAACSDAILEEVRDLNLGLCEGENMCTILSTISFETFSRFYDRCLSCSGVPLRSVDLRHCYNILVSPRYRALRRRMISLGTCVNDRWAVSVKVRGHDGTEVFFKILAMSPLKKLMDVYAQRQGLTPSAYRFIFDGNRIVETQTPLDLMMENDDVIDAMLEQVGDIGRFAQHHGSPGWQWLMGPSAPTAPVSARALHALVRQLGGRLGARPLCFSPPRVGADSQSYDGQSHDAPALLSRGDCAVLIRELDEAHSRQRCRDLKLTISASRLSTLIGQPAMSRLAERFGEAFNEIKLRRTDAMPGQCIAFHLDHSERTMQVRLIISRSEPNQ
jgi:small ubiquitin-related modifier